MQSHLLQSESEIREIQTMIASLGENSSVADFDELIQLPSIRSVTRIWIDRDELIAFAFVDVYQNLCFEIAFGSSTADLEQEIMAWGTECIRKDSKLDAENASVDAYCNGNNHSRISLLERNGFYRSPIQTLQFQRDLSLPIMNSPLPEGFSIRLTYGERELTKLVTLHQAAFKSDHMTAEYRLAMMTNPHYAADMDWLIVAPNGEMAAFCLGSIDESTPLIGHLDPIGVHPNYQGKGLGCAIVSYGLKELKQRGLTSAVFGTSSENLAMQKLARKTGFELFSTGLWFSKKIS